MILDSIIALFASLFCAVAEGVMLVAVPAINLGALCLEFIVGIFVSGFTLGRISRAKRESNSRVSATLGLVALLAILGVVAWIAIVPLVMERTVTLRAADGHSLPFAELIIQTEKNGGLSRRTDVAGNISIPRFGVQTLTVIDPRYVEKSWREKEIGAILVVERTVLGVGLDKLAEKLMKPVR